MNQRKMKSDISCSPRPFLRAHAGFGLLSAWPASHLAVAAKHPRLASAVTANDF